MRILYSPHHHHHSPEFELFNGERTPHAEVPQRIENILKALSDSGHVIEHVDQKGSQNELLRMLHRIHDHRYIEWLSRSHPAEPIYPSVINTTDMPLIHGHLSIQWGNFVTDTFTPLLPQTWSAASASAQCAYQASQLLIQGEHAVTVLSRPPGHHAGKIRVGGYCYLNNAAVAAEALSPHGKVAIIDVDYHHGNGTQDIFYDRSDVITCSIHADPLRKFPYFAGSSEEIGVGEGEGCNKNYPLDADVQNEQYQSVLEHATEWIGSHRPNFLIVSLGLDTHESDPIADFRLTTEYYKKMSQTLQLLGLPMIVVLEGGYSTDAIGKNVLSFLSGVGE